MSKQIKTNAGGKEGGYKRGVPTKFVSRNLMPVKGVVAQNQFAPTPAEPVRMHNKMAGGC
ncbi:MAG TPA: hypothetical protein DCQ33_17590 [Nitrospira sp.]|nr:hypothetical protein [Nitrospira sp.]